MSTAMAGAVGVPAFVSFASVGLEIKEAAPRVLRGFCEKPNWSCKRGDSRGRREWGTVVMARRGGGGSARSPRPSTSRGPKQQETSGNSTAISRKKTQKETKQEDDGWEDNEFDEDALEALFAQLEMDLEVEGTSDNEDLTEEEVIELENELVAALEDIEEEERREEELGTIDVVAEDAGTVPEVDAPSRDSKSSKRNKGKSGEQKTTITMKDELSNGILEEYEDEDEDEVEEQRVITLEPWQLRKLAAAVEIGRRKVNVKALSAEVGMDRFDVLTWLKNPPPELLMYSATMEDEESTDELPLEGGASSSFPANSNPAGKQDLVPDPEGGSSWHSQKRLKKEHEATFERVFSRTDRPSNAILQNLVELTHVPRRRIVEWFELRRKEVRGSPKFEALK